MSHSQSIAAKNLIRLLLNRRRITCYPEQFQLRADRKMSMPMGLAIWIIFIYIFKVMPEYSTSIIYFLVIFQIGDCSPYMVAVFNVCVLNILIVCERGFLSFNIFHTTTFNVLICQYFCCETISATTQYHTSNK